VRSGRARGSYSSLPKAGELGRLGRRRSLSRKGVASSSAECAVLTATNRRSQICPAVSVHHNRNNSSEPRPAQAGSDTGRCLGPESETQRFGTKKRLRDISRSYKLETSVILNVDAFSQLLVRLRKIERITSRATITTS
jgi:hypothetical protein